MKFTFHGRSDTGLIRSLNEDCILTIGPKDKELQHTRGDLLIVADGMGGHESGEVASRQAAETVGELYYRLPGGAEQALVRAIKEANAAVFQRAREENRQGMGTTVVAAARVGDELYIAHVGDSRLYLIREAEIRPLTADHSLVAEQVAAGILTLEEAERHPHRNVISRAVGTSPEVEVELSPASPLPLRDGDIILLCSDGLTEHVKAPRIQQLVQNRTPAEATDVLIVAANAAGGTDNVSVIVGRVGELPDAGDKTEPLATLTPVSEGATLSAPALSPVRRSPTAGSAGGRRGGWNALFSVLASLVVLALVGGLGYVALSLINDPPARAAPTETPQNNLLAPATAPPLTTVTLTVAGEGGAPGQEATPTASPTGSATPTRSPAASPTQTGTPLLASGTPTTTTTPIATPGAVVIP
ncbi:MAG: Stp1/IreP family PP2C-type Ser/Thr phosphatase [Ardenticatenaceae bacterium]